MATMGQWIVLLFWNIVCISASMALLTGPYEQATGCEDVCGDTYPQHTYEKSMHLSYCRRGCRLFNILDFVREDDDLNVTRTGCAQACSDCYKSADDQEACNLGCNNQMPFVAKRRQTLYSLGELELPLLSPLLYMHGVYSALRSHAERGMAAVSWSYSVQQSEPGHIVVVQSQPKYYVEYNIGPEEDDYKTSNYLETNLIGVDNSATVDLKASQVGGQIAEGSQEGTDWLGCIARKTGLPRLLLSLTIFMSAVVMIWLCFTSAATAPERRIQTQKLSIYGDLDYLKEIGMGEKLMSGIHPQDKTDACPLPIKVKVERV